MFYSACQTRKEVHKRNEELDETGLATLRYSPYIIMAQ